MNSVSYLEKRQVNFELLRIICMFAIVTGHFGYTFLGNNAQASSVEFGTYKQIFLFIWYSLSQFHVPCFFMISGYFLIKSDFRSNKIFSLWIITLFYSLVLGILSYFVLGQISLKELIKCIFPVSTREYWFVTVYIAGYLLFPFFNAMLSNISKQQFKFLLIILTIFLGVIPVLTNIDTLATGKGWGIATFAYYYFLGAYIRLYVPKNKVKKGACVIAYLSVASLVFISKELIYIIFKGSYGKSDYLSDYNNLFYAISSLSVFLFIYNCKFNFKPNIIRFINICSSSVFGIYLIHINPLLFKTLNTYLSPDSTIFQWLLFSLFVFTGCTIIEIARKKIFLIVQNYITFDKYNSFCAKINHIAK